ncbi:Melibiose/raffinose/stachyose import permease protein MelD [subsurface metagenome]
MKRRPLQYFFILPAAVWVLVFTVYPLIYVVRISFSNYQLGTTDLFFVGFRNYLDNFKDATFWNSLRVTLLYVSIAVTAQVTLGLYFAWILNKNLKGSKIFRTIFTSPLFVAPVAVGYLGITIFYETGGPVNYFLSFLGVHVPWLSDRYFALVSVILLDIWEWTPFIFIILLAALQSIPEDINEAAHLDVSSNYQLFWYISLPLITPALVIAFLLKLIESFKLFGLPFALTAGGPANATEVYSILTYRKSMAYFDFSHGAALAIFLLFVVMVCVVQFFRIIRERY